MFVASLICLVFFLIAYVLFFVMQKARPEEAKLLLIIKCVAAVIAFVTGLFFFLWAKDAFNEESAKTAIWMGLTAWIAILSIAAWLFVRKTKPWIEMIDVFVFFAAATCCLILSFRLGRLMLQNEVVTSSIALLFHRF